MRFMSMIYADQTQGPPPESLMEAMGKLIEDTTKSGKLVTTGGLAGPSDSTAVHLSGGKLSVTDGPFIEAKEMVGGYAIVDVASKEEAVQMAKDFLQLHVEHWPEFVGTCEVRQIFGP